jgi:hypothetical protein
MNDTPLATLMEAFATYNRAQGHSPSPRPVNAKPTPPLTSGCYNPA